MEGIAWNFACWCILTTFRTGHILVTVCWFSSLWRYFDLLKRVKFGFSGHFPVNAWREWPKILHADIYPDHLQSWLNFGYGLLIFLVMVPFLLSETGHIWGLRALSGERPGVNVGERRHVSDALRRVLFWCYLLLNELGKLVVVRDDCLAEPPTGRCVLLSKGQGNIKALHCWPFVRGIHHWPLHSHYKGTAIWKACLCHDVIMELTHWVRVTHICVSKLTTIGSYNGLSPGRRRAIIWSNAGILLIRTLGKNFEGISSEIHTFSVKKIHSKMLYAKWRPFCPEGNGLMTETLFRTV